MAETTAALPAEFLATADQITRADLLALDRYDLRGLSPTGSRWICPQAARTDSDWDVLAMATTDAVIDMAFDGWRYGGSFRRSFVEGRSTQQFVSLKNGSVNVLACLDDLFYARFIRATEVCRQQGGPVDRPGRVAVFKRILYPESAGSRFLDHVEAVQRG